MTGDQVEPTPYEKQILREIHAWRQRQPGSWGRVVARANKEVRKVTDLAFKVPGVQWTVDNVAAGLLRVTNELVQDTVWQESIYAAYRRQGHPRIWNGWAVFLLLFVAAVVIWPALAVGTPQTPLEDACFLRDGMDPVYRDILRSQCARMGL